MEKLNSIEFDWSVEAGKFGQLPTETPPGVAAAAVAPGAMAMGATPPKEVDVLMKAAEAAASPAGMPKAAPTPAITWARPDSQKTKTQTGVTQMAVRLEMER